MHDLVSVLPSESPHQVIMHAMISFLFFPRLVCVFSLQSVMKDKWMNLGYDEEELKPYLEPSADINDPARIRKTACICHRFEGSMDHRFEGIGHGP